MPGAWALQPMAQTERVLPGMQPAHLLEDPKESSISAGREVEGAQDLELHEEEPVRFPHGQVPTTLSGSAGRATCKPQAPL